MNRVTYEDIIAFAAGELGGREAADVEAHLAANPDAAASVARFRAAHAAWMTDDGAEPPETAVRRAKSIFGAGRRDAAAPGIRQYLEMAIAKLVFDSRARLALAGYRSGTASGFQLAFESGSATIDLDAQPLGDSGDERTWEVVGQVDDERSPGDWEISLVPRGGSVPVARSTCDPSGAFAIEAPSGRYDLFIGGAGRKVVLPDIALP